MNYLKIIICFAFCLALNLGYAQYNWAENLSPNNNMIRRLDRAGQNQTIKEITEPRKVKGDPFLYDDFQTAILEFVDPEEENLELLLNYNVFADFMKIKSENEEVQLLPRGWNYDVLIRDQRFRYISFQNGKKELNSYVEILEVYEDGSYLALRRVKEVTTNPRKRYISDNEFYLIDLNGSSIELKNNNQIVSQNVSKEVKESLRQYVERNNIKFEKDLKGLKGVARYYASIR